jgi:hypothetical protein
MPGIAPIMGHALEPLLRYAGLFIMGIIVARFQGAFCIGFRL